MGRTGAEASAGGGRKRRGRRQREGGRAERTDESNMRLNSIKVESVKLDGGGGAGIVPDRHVCMTTRL